MATLRHRSSARLGVLLAIGLVATLITAITGAWAYAPAVGWDVAGLTFISWIWRLIARMDSAQTRTHATSEDPGRAASDLILLAASIASLGAVGFVLVEAERSSGAAKGVLAGLGVLSVVVSWIVVHTLFTLRYASLYYSDPIGGIDFNQSEPPRYTDFGYLAFTLGMTYQVSDTDLQTHAIRASALRHALLSYLFGAVILASTINLIVSLGSSGG